MGFFNKKEEVLDFQLTTYGKELYSKGKLNPEYYAFFDEGILYDITRAGLTEIQNNTQFRIKNETPQTKGIKEYLNPDALEKMDEIVPKEIDAREISLFDFDSAFENQLGASRSSNEFVPSWQVTALVSDITSSTPYLPSSLSTSRNLPIPQINIDSNSIAYRTVISKGSILEESICEDGEIGYIRDDEPLVEFPDGTSLMIEENQILLKFKEQNVESLIDNFEIEIFEVFEKPNNKPSKLKPLKFFKFQPQIQNGLLVDETFGERDMENLDLVDETFVSHYLEILTDQEVDQRLLCDLDLDRKDDTIFIKDLISCETFEDEETHLYGEIDDANMEDFFDEEECE